MLAHFTRILARWPVDRLRPETQHFQRLLQNRIDNASADSTDVHARKEANAAYLLLDDTFAKKFPLSEKIMRPASQPEHYEALGKRLEEAPNLTFVDRVVKRLKGMVRWK